MQKNILFALLGVATILGGLYSFQNFSQQQDENIQIEGLTAYEDDITFNGSTCTWDLTNQSITDSLLTSICKTIERRLASMAPEPITVFNLKMSQNKIVDPSPLFTSISKSTISTTLESLWVDLGENKVQSVDFFADWSIPQKLNHFGFFVNQNYSNAYSRICLSSVSGLATALSNMSLSTLQLGFNYNLITDMEELLDVLQQYRSGSLTKLNLNFNNNRQYTIGFVEQVPVLLAKQQNIDELNLGLSNSGIDLDFLNQLESPIYSMSYLNKFTINTSSNSLNTADVNNIFQDLSERIGADNVTIIN